MPGKEKKLVIRTREIIPRNPELLKTTSRGGIHQDKRRKFQSKYRERWRKGMDDEAVVADPWEYLDEGKVKRVHPDLRVILKRNPGWRIDGTKGQHHRLVHDDHPGKSVTAAATPSDWRTYKNVEAQMKAIEAGRVTDNTQRSETPRADAVIAAGFSKRKQKKLRKQGKLEA